jgi:hypothetical protein
MSAYDKPRARKVVGNWIEDQEHIIGELTSDETLTSPEQLLEATGVAHEDLAAMKGLYAEMERDCE